MNEFKIIEGIDGLDLFQFIRNDEENKIKCIFIDENMEYMNGSESVRIIRKLEQFSKIKKYFIISITALEDHESKKNILNSGVDLIIPKPCTSSDLIKIFKTIK